MIVLWSNDWAENCNLPHMKLAGEFTDGSKDVWGEEAEEGGGYSSNTRSH